MFGVDAELLVSADSNEGESPLQLPTVDIESGERDFDTVIELPTVSTTTITTAEISSSEFERLYNEAGAFFYFIHIELLLLWL